MEIRLATGPLDQLEADALVTFCIGGVHLRRECRTLASRNCSTRANSPAKPQEITILHAPAGLKVKRLVLAGAWTACKIHLPRSAEIWPEPFCGT